MGSYSDCSSDQDEELPVFDFLQPRPRLNQTSRGSRTTADVVALDDSDTERATRPTPRGRSNGGGTDLMTISSDSDDDEPYVPLALRLKQKHGNAPSAASAEQNPLGLHRGGRVSPEELEDPSSPAKRKPAKRTAQEIQVCREEALGRKQARERQQAERRALAEAAKALRPEECIKHMVVAVDPALLQLEGGGTLLASVQALGCSCAIEKQPIPRSVSWMRRAAGAQMEGDSLPEVHVVLQMTVDDFITLVHSYIQEERRGRSDGSPTLTSWVQDQQRRHPAKTLSLAVIEVETYFRLQKSQKQKKFREAVAGEDAATGRAKKRRRNDGGGALPEVSRVEVEEAAVHLQLHTGVTVHFLSTWKDFSDHITMTTKAVAEAPFKRAREQTGFGFYLEAAWAGGQRVEKAGKGLLQVWKRQIQQLNRVSPDMAAAVVAAYPSPQLLRKAYSRCRSDGEKASLLSDLLIRRGEGVTSTTRRVGPELSKRLFLLMQSWNPELTLDSGL